MSGGLSRYFETCKKCNLRPSSQLSREHSEIEMILAIFEHVEAASFWIQVTEGKLLSYQRSMISHYIFARQQNCTTLRTRMWANVQRDGHPSECSGAFVQRRKLWLTPTTRVPCSNANKTRNAMIFAGLPQTRQQISAASGLKFTIL